MKKKLFRVVLIILLMLPVIAFAHFVAFPQETRCMLIRFADFEKKGNIYFRAGTDPSLISKMQQLQKTAEKRDKDFWQENYIPDYKIIFCISDKDYNNYGFEGTPACTQRKMGVSVVVSMDGMDHSVIAHELSHGILYNNIGWYKINFNIPFWFDEGLAMQTDDRDYYSIDTLLAKRDRGVQLPDVKKLKNAGDFFSGNQEQVMLNYSAAKYEIHEWLKTHSLKKFISLMNSGKGFSAAYDQKKP